MKIIEGNILTLGKVYCSCCGESHYLTIQRDRNRIKGGDIYYFDFKQEEWSNLTERFRIMKAFLKDKGRTLFDNILIENEQLQDFLELLKQDLLSEKDGKKYMEDISIVKFNFNSYNRDYISYEKGWFEITLFQTKNEFIIIADCDEDKEGNICIIDISIGWYINQKLFTSKFNKWKYALKFLFKKEKYPIRENSICLNRKETVEMMASLYGLLSMIKKR